MKLRALNGEDRELMCRVGFGLTWAQAVFGVFLLMQNVHSYIHIILAVLLTAGLLLARFGWEHKAARIIGRVITGLYWAMFAAFAAESILITADADWKNAAVMLLSEYCLFGGLVFSWLSPAAFAFARRGGKYDGVVACFGQVLLAGAAAVGAFTQTLTGWSWDNDTVRLIWFILAVLTTLMTFLSVCLRGER